MDVEMITRNYMLYFLLPLWLVPGFLDWICHRRTRIEETSGLKEALIHQLQLATVGLPVLMGLFLQIDSLVIVVMIVAFFLHEASSVWDVSYAKELRHVSAMEQHVHGYLNVIPFMALSFVVCLHWDQLLGIVGLGEGCRWTLAWKEPALSPTYLAVVVGLFVVLLVIPYGEEVWRCRRAARTRRAAGALDCGPHPVAGGRGPGRPTVLTDPRGCTS